LEVCERARPGKGEGDSRDLPGLFSQHHAIELYLKAFLRGNGHSANELSTKKYEHDIKKLSGRAAELGLWYLDEDKEVFAMISTTDAIIRSRYVKT
jgi:hypothetical protein